MAVNVQNIERFKFIAHKIIPLVYDDSLSYYEFLCKVMQKLNEVISYLDNHLGTPDVVQTTGTSATDVMSQKAVTDEINAIKSDITELQTALIGVSDLIGGGDV